MDFSEMKASNLSIPSVSKSQIRIDFPELKSEYKMPIILVYPDPEHKGKIFLCSRTIANNLNNLSEEYTSKLMTWDDFVNYIATESPVDLNISVESEVIACKKKEYINGFASHINEQKHQLTQLQQNLNNMYSGKCQELIKSLQGVIDNETTTFRQNYELLSKQTSEDKEKSAEIDKFHEIRHQVESLSGDNEAIEAYIRKVLRKKHLWEKVSTNLQNYSQREEKHYVDGVQNHFENKPTFTSAEKILDQWKEGLDNLVKNVIDFNSNKTKIVVENYKKEDGILVEINNVEELQLVTKAMIKAETQVVLNYNRKPLDLEETKLISSHLETLSEISYIDLNFESNNSSIKIIDSIFEGVKNLSSLKHFGLNLYGNNLKDSICDKLNFLADISTLEEVSINLSFNQIGDKGVDVFSSILGQLGGLQKLNLNLSHNSIQEKGATSIAEALLSLTALTSLNLNLGGYSQVNNKITSDGAIAIGQSLSELVLIQDLTIDLGYTSIKDSGAIAIARSISKMKNISKVDIGLYNNDISSTGVQKLVKVLKKKVFVRDINLNLNNNTKIKNTGLDYIFEGINAMESLTKLNLLLRNIGLAKKSSTDYKIELENNKTGSPYTELKVNVY